MSKDSEMFRLFIASVLWSLIFSTLITILMLHIHSTKYVEECVSSHVETKIRETKCTPYSSDGLFLCEGIEKYNITVCDKVMLVRNVTESD